mgnify:CR=1 FL=1
MLRHTAPDVGTAKLDTSDAASKLDAILAAIAKLDTKFDTVATDLNLLRADQRKIAVRITRVETEVAVLYPQTKDIEAQVLELQKGVGFLEYRAEDAKGRARRNNLAKVGDQV